MNRTVFTLLLVFVALSFGLLSGDLRAQGGAGEPAGAKALFFSGEGTTMAHSSAKPVRRQTEARASTPSNPKYMGISYWIDRLSKDGEMKRVNSSTVFKQGDRIKVSLKSNREGYLYVINLGSTGNSTILFPNARTPQGSNRIFPDQTYEIPPKGFFRFDENPGEETLLVMLSPTPMDSGAPTLAPPGQMSASAPPPSRFPAPVSEETAELPPGVAPPPPPQFASPEETAELPQGSTPPPPPQFPAPAQVESAGIPVQSVPQPVPQVAGPPPAETAGIPVQSAPQPVPAPAEEAPSGVLPQLPALVAGTVAALAEGAPQAEAAETAETAAPNRPHHHHGSPPPPPAHHGTAEEHHGTPKEHQATAKADKPQPVKRPEPAAPVAAAPKKPQPQMVARNTAPKPIPRGRKDLAIEDLTVEAQTKAVGQKDLVFEEERGPNPVSYAVAPVSVLEQGGKLISLKISLKHK